MSTLGMSNLQLGHVEAEESAAGIVIGPTVTLTTPKTRSAEPRVFQLTAYGAANTSFASGAPSS
jgi:hypothetical protein